MSDICNRAILPLTFIFMISSTQTNHPLKGSADDLVAVGSRLSLACDRLRGAGLRITQPRVAIINILINSDQPISIEKIHTQLDGKSCDLVTVYRCLGAFEDIGIVRRSFLHNGTSLYQLNDRHDAAYHIVSKETGEMQALDEPTSARLAALIGTVEQELRANGYENVTHVLGFFVKNTGAAGALPVRNRQVTI